MTLIEGVSDSGTVMGMTHVSQNGFLKISIFNPTKDNKLAV